MTAQSPHNDKQTGDVPHKEKKSIVRFITAAVVLFLIFVLSYMLLNGKPEPEELPINNNPTIQETEQ